MVEHASTAAVSIEGDMDILLACETLGYRMDWLTPELLAEMKQQSTDMYGSVRSGLESSLENIQGQTVLSISVRARIPLS